MNTVCKCNQTGKNYDRITEKLRDRRQNSFQYCVNLSELITFRIYQNTKSTTKSYNELQGAPISQSEPQRPAINHKEPKRDAINKNELQ